MIGRRLMQAMIVHRDHDKGGSQGRPRKLGNCSDTSSSKFLQFHKSDRFVAFGVFASLYDFHSLFDRRFECLF